jgi:hypothetical protein
VRSENPAEMLVGGPGVGRSLPNGEAHIFAEGSFDRGFE